MNRWPLRRKIFFWLGPGLLAKAFCFLAKGLGPDKPAQLGLKLTAETSLMIGFK
jgi:hypothetical protein